VAHYFRGSRPAGAFFGVRALLRLFAAGSSAFPLSPPPIRFVYINSSSCTPICRYVWSACPEELVSVMDVFRPLTPLWPRSFLLRVACTFVVRLLFTPLFSALSGRGIFVFHPGVESFFLFLLSTGAALHLSRLLSCSPYRVLLFFHSVFLILMRFSAVRNCVAIVCPVVFLLLFCPPLYRYRFCRF